VVVTAVVPRPWASGQDAGGMGNFVVLGNVDDMQIPLFCGKAVSSPTAALSQASVD